MSDWNDITVNLGLTIPGFDAWTIRGGLYVNDYRFCSEVLLTANRIYVITYTVNAELVEQLGNVKSLIYNKAIFPPLPKKLKAAQVNNMHTKLYIVDGDVWVGSMNLVRPSRSGLHNMMVRLEGGQAASAKLYHGRVWDAVKNQADT